MKVKNITALGARSAVGISDVSGVWVVEILKDSEVQGLIQVNDVILRINQTEVNDIREMKEVLIRTKNQINITLFRNQKQ